MPNRVKYCILLTNLSMSKKIVFTKRWKRGYIMISYDLIWRLIEMLLADKSKAEEQQDKD